MIKIFCLPSHQGKEHTSGVDFARIIQPMNYLGLIKGFKVDVWDVNEPKITKWDMVAKNYDIIYFNYINSPWGFAAMGCMARKYGKLLVMDLDDALWKIMPDNMAYPVYKKGSEGIKNITCIMNEVDFITTTNRYLKNVINANTAKPFNKIEVFPNSIDLGLYKHRSKTRKEYNIVITHFGSTSHFENLQSEEFAKAMDRIMREYPQVIFKTIGAFLPKYKKRWGARYEHGFGATDIRKWIDTKYPKVMDETDFFVTPLVVNTYNRSKSYIKWLEISAAKKPGIWQRIRQYEKVVEHGKTGLLANYADDWYHAKKKLIDSYKLRKEIGENAYKEVKKYTIQEEVKRYAEYFKKISA